ncbi:MAG: putative cytochrome c-type biosis protein [Francisellaceae bacterium]|nr:putative cytochrome c-type biosis protein [Francisellaceae bacterium]
MELMGFWLIICLLTIIGICFFILFLGKNHFPLKCVLIIGFVIFNLGLYYQFGAYKQLNDYYSESSKKNRLSIRPLQLLIHQLKKEEYRLRLKLEHDPKNISYWWELSEIYQRLNEPEKACFSLKQAYDLDKNNLNMLANYLSLYIRLSDGKLDNESKTLVKRLLKDKINKKLAYNLLAMDAYKNKNYKQAIYYWSQLIKYLGPDSPMLESIHKLITNAKLQVGNLSNTEGEK